MNFEKVFRPYWWQALLYVPFWLWLIFVMFRDYSAGQARIAACKADGVYPTYICESLR